MIHLIERSKCLEKDESKNTLFNGHNLKTLYEKNINVLNNIITNYEKNNTIIDKKYKNTSGLIDGNAVGIQITEKGIAIHEFSNSDNKNINFSIPFPEFVYPYCFIQLFNIFGLAQCNSNIVFFFFYTIF